ncbi:MalY/PatB family protein [Vibrio sp. WJH972]
MKYNFDKVIDRKGTNALNNDGYRKYLFGDSTELSAEIDIDNLIPMWVADMNFSVAPEILDAIKQRLEHGILGYTKLFDDAYFQAFIQWVKGRYNWEINQQHIVTLHGVVPALFDLVRLFTKPDEKVLFTTPSYGFFQHAAQHHNREYVTSDLINTDGYYTFDFDDLREKCADSKVTLCILCNPHNPTGRAWSEDELKQFAEICFEYNVLILSDDIHCDLTRNYTCYTPLARLYPNSDQIITCMAPSKTFNLAGLMMSNIIIPNEAMRTVWLDDHIDMLNPLSLSGAEAAYTSGGAWLEQLTHYLDANFDYVKTELEKQLPLAQFSIPEATYLAWIDLSNYFDSDQNLTQFFIEEAGMIVEGGEMFVSENNGFIRVNLAHSKHTVMEGIARICQAVQKQVS